MKITTKLFTFMFFLLALTIGASAQIVAPTGITTRASSQLVYYYDLTTQMSVGSTDIQVTNTNATDGVTVHVQIFRSFDQDGSGTTFDPVLCDERDFVDFLTPNDTHVYDLSIPGFDKNTGEAEGQEGESTSIDLTQPVPTKGFVVITPVVSEADLSAISFQHLTGTSNDDTRSFIINAMGRDAVNFTTGEIVPQGTPLDGTTNGFLQLQPEEVIFDFESDGGPVDVVGIAFHDEYGDPGLLGYQVTPGEVNWTPFIFDYKEAVTSCGERTVSCFDTTGLNDTIPHNNFTFNGNDLLCAGSSSSLQPGISFASGWTRIFVSGLDDFENHVGVFYSTEERGADFMHVKGDRTEIDPEPPAEVCDDGIDNDEDGFTDCADSDCTTNEACETGAAECTDGMDNDEDGDTDCADLGCDGTVIDSESGATCESDGETSCDDGFDNDGDGDIDSADSDCMAADTGTTGGTDDGDGGGCTVATAVTTGTAAANFLLPLLPLAGAYGYRRLRRRSSK